MRRALAPHGPTPAQLLAALRMNGDAIGAAAARVGELETGQAALASSKADSAALLAGMTDLEEADASTAATTAAMQAAVASLQADLATLASALSALTQAVGGKAASSHQHGFSAIGGMNEVTASPDANGQAIVDHGLGFTPALVIALPPDKLATAGYQSVVAKSWTATKVTLLFERYTVLGITLGGLSVGISAVTTANRPVRLIGIRA